MISPSGENIQVTGTGTATNPYVIDAASEISTLSVEDEGAAVRTGVTLLDFQGGGITATAGGEGEVIVTVPTPPTPGIAGVTANVQTFTVTGVWTKPANCLYAEIEVVGGGGGSGGIGATAAGQNASSAGGGGGGYARKMMLGSALAATVTVTVGAGGTAGLITPGAGGTGGLSAFGAHCQATGGVGGAPMSGVSVTTYVDGGVGGVGTGGDLHIPGGKGGYGTVSGAVRLNTGMGGASQMGRGGQAGNNAIGETGPNYGGGAGGSTNNASLAARSGAVGGGGLVIVTAYSKT